MSGKTVYNIFSILLYKILFCSGLFVVVFLSRLTLCIFQWNTNLVLRNTAHLNFRNYIFLIKAVNKGGRGCQSRPSFLVLNFWAHFLIKAVNKGGRGCQSRWIRVPRPAGEDSSSRIRGHFPSLSFRQTDVNVIILSFRFSSFGIAPGLRSGLVRLREPSGAQLWLFTFNI